MKADEQYFLVVLFITYINILYKVVQVIQFVCLWVTIQMKVSKLGFMLLAGQGNFTYVAQTIVCFWVKLSCVLCCVFYDVVLLT